MTVQQELKDLIHEKFQEGDFDVVLSKDIGKTGLTKKVVFALPKGDAQIIIETYNTTYYNSNFYFIFKKAFWFFKIRMDIRLGFDTLHLISDIQKNVLKDKAYKEDERKYRKLVDNLSHK